MSNPLLVLLVLLWPAVPPQGEERLVALREELRLEGDRADTATLHELAALGTRPALEALLAAYSSFGSILMRSESLRALTAFEGLDCCEQTAFVTIAEAAVGSSDPEVREAALRALAGSSGVGRAFLRSIVESPGDERVRVAALEAHAAGAQAAERDFYRELWRPTPLSAEEEKERKREEKARQTAKKRGQTIEEPLRLTRPPRLRRVAFTAVAPHLSDEDVLAGLSDGEWSIRGVALLELERRGSAQLLERARKTLLALDEYPQNRALAAGVLARAEGARAGELFLELADRAMTPDALRSELADLMAGIADDGLRRKLVRALTQGKAREKLFALRALRATEDPEHGARLVRLLADREPEVAIAAARQLAERGESRADPELAKLVEGSKDPDLRLAAFQARARLNAGSPAWVLELEKRAADPDIALRAYALRGLGATREERFLPLLHAALDDPSWSIRVAALDGLVAQRRAEAVPWILARMEREDGRLLRECAEALWRLSGKPFELSAARWKQWWESEGRGFEPIDEAALARLAAEREERRLRETSRVASRFFGVKIESRRVLFVLDVSGSMRIPVASPAESGKPETRMEVAKRELQRSLESLDPATWFNVLAFGGEVSSWSGRAMQASPEKVAEASAWVRRLGLSMTGTALWDVLRAAFADPTVDTILLLSDGMPSGGTKEDPSAIREDVASWNRDRKVVIHTIALGEELQVLRWLADDSGGSHVFVP